MKRTNPTNATYLAAELAQVMQVPGQSAHIAAELCAIGRRYTRIGEKLCGGEEVWGVWSDAVERAQDRAIKTQDKLLAKAQALVAGLPVTIEEHSLHLQACTSIKKGYPAAQTCLS